MKTRGYPVSDFDQRAADISVDHPRVVENYRGPADSFRMTGKPYLIRLWKSCRPHVQNDWTRCAVMNGSHTLPRSVTLRNDFSYGPLITRWA